MVSAIYHTKEKMAMLNTNRDGEKEVLESEGVVIWCKYCLGWHE